MDTSGYFNPLITFGEVKKQNAQDWDEEGM
jgi:hypothetical protein